MKTTKALTKWNSDDISAWLASIGMKPFIRAFKTNKITGRDLCQFNEDDLRTKCKISARPVRKILFKRLKHIQSRLKSNENESDDEKMEETISAPMVETKVVEEKRVPVGGERAVVQKKVKTKTVEVVIQDQEEEHPRYTPDEASFIIQGLYRCLKAHQIVVQMIRNQYRKVYSLQTGIYVYKYVGVINQFSCVRVFSDLIDLTTASKPINLQSNDLKISFTEELATMRIQLFARYCISMKRARALVRQKWKRIFDPISGRHFYYCPQLKVKCWKKSKILGGESWDPLDIANWTEDDVILYFRRLRLSKHGILNQVQRFGINGQLLQVLDLNDLICFRIPDNIAKQIISDRNKNSPAICTHGHSRKALRRRKILRFHFHLTNSAIIIQKTFRRYLCVSKMDAFMKSIQRYSHQKQERIPFWWSHRNLQHMVVSEGYKKRKTYILEGSNGVIHNERAQSPLRVVSERNHVSTYLRS